MIKLEQRMLEVDGATLEVFVGGEGPLLCASHPHATFTEEPLWQTAGIPARIVHMNARGFGRAAPVRDVQDYSVDQFLMDLEAVRRQLGGESWIYMGYS